MEKMRNLVAASEPADSAYQSLFTLGGVAALLVVVFTLGEIIGLIIFPQPGTAGEWFALFQNNAFVGLLDFWGLEVPMYAMFVMVFLAFYIVLRKGNESLLLIASAFALLGIGIFFATNNPFSMLSLSNQYAAATTDAQRSSFLAAGQAILANTNQRAVGGFNTGLFFVSVAGLMVSSAMLRSNVFGKPTAYAGILANALSLADNIREALTSSEIITLLVVLPNALFLMVWFVLIGRTFLRLGRLVALPIPTRKK
jgi:hypothetical protein